MSSVSGRVVFEAFSPQPSSAREVPEAAAATLAQRLVDAQADVGARVPEVWLPAADALDEEGLPRPLGRGGSALRTCTALSAGHGRRVRWYAWKAQRTDLYSPEFYPNYRVIFQSFRLYQITLFHHL